MYIYIQDLGTNQVLSTFLLLTSFLLNYNTAEALVASLGHNSAHSLVIGPVMAEPLTSPLALIKIAALSSQNTKTPSALLHGFLCLIITDGTTFFLNSGLPLLTETKIQSPILAVGSLFKTPEILKAAITFKILAPLWSAQANLAPVGIANEILIFVPDIPALPLLTPPIIYVSFFIYLGFPC